MPLGDSVGEMARLHEEGKVAAVGLSSVSLLQVQAALALVPITSGQKPVQPVEPRVGAGRRHPFLRRELHHLSGLLPRGRRAALLRESPELREMGARHGRATPEELVLAWILGASPSLPAIPGASRVARIESSVRS